MQKPLFVLLLPLLPLAREIIRREHLRQFGKLHRNARPYIKEILLHL